MNKTCMAAGLCLTLGGVQAHAADAGAPPTQIQTVTDTYRNVKVDDPYRWLEDSASKPVKDWTAAQTKRTRAALDALPVRPAIRNRLAALIKGGSGAWFDFRVAGTTVFARHADPHYQQPLLVALGPDADPAKAKIVLDPGKLDVKGTGAVSFDWYLPSPNGRFIAVSLSRGGSEVGDLHIFDASGTDIGDMVPRVQNPTGGGSVAWAADSMGYFYTRYPGAERPPEDRGFYQQLYYHYVGREWSKYDQAVPLGKDLPRIAEIKLDNRYNQNYVLASVLNGDGGDVEHFVITGAEHHVYPLAHFGDGVRQAIIAADGSTYLVSRKTNPNGVILKLAPNTTELALAKEIIHSTANPIVTDGDEIVPGPDKLYVNEVAGGPSAIGVYGLDGKPQGEVTLPAVSAVTDLTLLSSGDLLIGIGSFTRPSYAAIYGAKDAKLTETKLAASSPAKFDDAEILRLTATSKDGAKIPFTVIRRKGTAADGAAPTLLTGYGGYGVVEAPRFLGASGRLWLDAGGVIAIANIRGGGDHGERWHRDGSLTHKQNVFDDFAAVGAELAKEKITSPAHLALQGRSNGGLLMGAEIAQHPDLAKAVVSWVGIYDMLRVELDPNGQFNTTEFGSVKDDAQFKALYAYSPYHHVKDGTKYPAVLLITGENDGRVNPMQSRKMAARLQAATDSGLPVYLETRSDVGHGHGTPLDAGIDQEADAMAFLFNQLGMNGPKG